MKDPSFAVQTALYNVLRGAFPPTTGVHSEVPLANGKVVAGFPYVQIGEDQVLSEADQCHDAASVFATVHVWSRKGFAEAKGLMARVLEVLDVLVPVEGFGVITSAVEDGPRHFTDADGLTRHSVVTFRYRMAPLVGP